MKEVSQGNVIRNRVLSAFCGSTHIYVAVGTDLTIPKWSRGWKTSWNGLALRFLPSVQRQKLFSRKQRPQRPSQETKFSEEEKTPFQFHGLFSARKWTSWSFQREDLEGEGEVEKLWKFWVDLLVRKVHNFCSPGFPDIAWDTEGTASPSLIN